MRQLTWARIGPTVPASNWLWIRVAGEVEVQAQRRLGLLASYQGVWTDVIFGAAGLIRLSGRNNSRCRRVSLIAEQTFTIYVAIGTYWTNSLARYVCIVDLRPNWFANDLSLSPLISNWGWSS